MKIFKGFFLLILLLITIAVYMNYPKLNMISGYASKYMASSVLIGKRSPASVVSSDLSFPLIELATTNFNKRTRKATANVYGLMERKTIDRQGLGTVLVNEEYVAIEKYLQPRRDNTQIAAPYPYGHLAPKDTIFPEVDYNKLLKAMASAFENSEVQKTRTLLVLYKGHLLSEKYIDGFSKDSPILGWSMTKSVLATCFGILEQKGKLEIDTPAPIAEWKKDSRKEISINHLLRMQSGLAWDEDYTTISDATKMLFLDADMTKNQKEKNAVAKPTEIWNYSSGTSNLLSGILRSQFKTHQEYLDFPYTSFIDKIGAHSTLLEADLSGNYVGSSYGWASTRDWARMGQLYLDKGYWNGEQLFNENWITYITTPTRNSNGRYGAHFWLNTGGFYKDVPKDLYSMNGFQGQYVFIIPSKDLVVVRTGLAEHPTFDANLFLKNLIETIH